MEEDPKLRDLATMLLPTGPPEGVNSGRTCAAWTGDGCGCQPDLFRMVTATAAEAVEAGIITNQVAAAVGAMKAAVGTTVAAVGAMVAVVGAMAAVVGAMVAVVGAMVAVVGAMAAAVGTMAAVVGTMASAVGTMAAASRAVMDTAGTAVERISTGAFSLWSYS